MTRGRLSIVLVVAVACLAAAAFSPVADAAGASSSSAASGAGPIAAAPPVLNDLLFHEYGPEALELPIGLGALPGARETAAFAAGRVACAVVFLESDGSIMKSSEDWSAARKDAVLDKVQSALDWWNDRSPDGSLEVFVPAAGSPGAPRTVKTGYEPIRMSIGYGWKGRPVTTDAAWRWQAMSSLGVGHDAKDDSPKPETLYAQKVRQKNNADWAFVLYVVDSLNDGDGMFANRVVAYTADLFGPYCMLTYDNDGYHFANFDAVLAHEMGHVFGALDEYAPPAPGYPSTGNLRSGYLGVLNGNAVVGGNGGAESCIMLGSNGTLDAFASGDLCRWTRGQTGLRDTDGDTRPDVVDTKPAIATRLESTAANGAVALRGSVAEKPRKRGRISGGVYFRRDLSILVPHDARYRIDDGAWQPLTAVDGAFGEPSEAWTLTTGALAPGHYKLELEAASGETAGRTRILWAGDTPVQLEFATDAAFTKTTASVKAGKAARIYVRSTSGGLPVSRLAPVKLVRVADKRVLATLATGENGVWTGTITPERTRTYEVRFAGAGQFLGPVASSRITIKVR
jgi:hypothetical protein